MTERINISKKRKEYLANEKTKTYGYLIGKPGIMSSNTCNFIEKKGVSWAAKPERNPDTI